jgi:acyl-CoA reductase-like NAD-dependent aldehyde dehydrogenase
MATTAVQVQPGKLFIGGQWAESASGKTFPTVNPATGEVITQLAAADEADVENAVRAARAASTEALGADVPGGSRPAVASDRRSHREHIDEFAYLETIDNGKPIFESRYVDLPMVVDVFHYYAGWATKIHGETIPVRGPYFNYTLREPIGVVAAIVPWNFPLLLASWKIAPALACGNTVILKPSELTSLTALKFAEICQQAGVPDGVVNVLTGEGPVAGLGLVQHPGVDKIAFTGSTEPAKPSCAPAPIL